MAHCDINDYIDEIKKHYSIRDNYRSNDYPLVTMINSKHSEVIQCYITVRKISRTEIALYLYNNIDKYISDGYALCYDYDDDIYYRKFIEIDDVEYELKKIYHNGHNIKGAR